MIPLIPGYMIDDTTDPNLVYIVCENGNVARGPFGEKLVFTPHVERETLVAAAKAHETYLTGLYENLGLLLGRDAPIGFTTYEDDTRRSS